MAHIISILRIIEFEMFEMFDVEIIKLYYCT